jgi:hypothetical protein
VSPVNAEAAVQVSAVLDTALAKTKRFAFDWHWQNGVLGNGVAVPNVTVHPVARVPAAKDPNWLVEPGVTTPVPAVQVTVGVVVEDPMMP